MIFDRNGYGAIALLGCLVAQPAAAMCEVPVSSANTNALPRITQAPKIDGIVEPEIWAGAMRMALDVETRPAENDPAKVDTQLLMMENGSHLFVAFQAHDPEPEKIRAFLRDRDSAWDDDFVGVVLDTFNDERQAFEFFANPFGSQMDLIYDDVNGDEDSSWDAIWDSAGRITEQGYEVEMAIPLQQLRFPKMDGQQTWGLDAIRFRPRDKRRRLSINEQDRGVDCYLCQLTKIEGFACAEPGRSLVIAPTLTSNSARSRSDPATEPLTSSSETDLGLDVRWGITPNLIMTSTLNPDFSQVEADVAQLDVNEQFALFFPESRPFFLEGADFFNTNIRAVFTRNIASPDYGLKLLGKQDRNGYGVFAAEDERTNLLIPGRDGSDTETLESASRALVGRYRRDVGENSSLGVLLTSRSGDDNDYSNTVAGVDGRYRINNSNSVDFQYLHTQTRYPDALAEEQDQPRGRFSDAAWSLNYQHRSRNWRQYTLLRDYGKDFRADLGFVPRVNWRQAVIGGGHLWYPGERWDELQLRGDWDITYDQDGELQERETEMVLQARGPLQSFLEAGVGHRDRRFDGILFSETFGFTYTEFKPRSGLFVGLLTQWGDQIDFDNARLGKRLRMRPEVRWNLGDHLLFRVRHNFSRLNTENTDERIFTANLTDARLTWQFNVRSFLRLVVLHEDIKRNQSVFDDPVDGRSRELGAQLLYSYKINPQSVLFVGYSSALEDGVELDSFETTDETFFLKLGYAFLP